MFDLYRKGKLEWKILEHIQKFLSGCGAKVIMKNDQAVSVKADLHVKLSLLEFPSIKEPILELTHDSTSMNQNWLNLFRNECWKLGTKFNSNQEVNQLVPYVRVQLKYPEINDELFWNRFGENCAIIVAMGILARLQGNSPLSFLSNVSFENFPILFGASSSKKQMNDSLKKVKKDVLDDQKLTIEKPSKIIREAEVFFDYRLLIDKSDNKKIKVLGNLHIKNIGTEVLRNPVICLRSTSEESIKITGQILPPNVAETFGVMSNEGPKGWKYMNEDWFEQTMKGETWICPIQQMNIYPQQIESLSNLQINIFNLEEQESILVEAFVFFKEQGLEFAANNRVSISLL
ncbi:hypothetical protein [Ectobacillus panaciterrae]|uniref:hypothetical protein n=1 Tax=Ectobacillus panaciterrae TaxID=363872 RepID=UPI001B7F8628|nr:hypothetical protein [Ectobacillus panaciterrae]